VSLLVLEKNNVRWSWNIVEMMVSYQHWSTDLCLSPHLSHALCYLFVEYLMTLVYQNIQPWVIRWLTNKWVGMWKEAVIPVSIQMEHLSNRNQKCYPWSQFVQCFCIVTHQHLRTADCPHVWAGMARSLFLQQVADITNWLTNWLTDKPTN
jgi:hypothetical protein